MLLTVDTTEAVEAIAEAQENLQEVAKNPGILRTYFQNLVPDLLNFALQVVIAVIVYAVGAKLIGLIVKIVRKTMERRNVWDSNYLSGGSARFLWCGGWSCTAGKSLQLCRRSADPFAKTFCGRRLYH